MSSAIKFDRTPYTVTYHRDGVKHTIRRRPPKKVHDAMPTDIVELKHRKNDEFLEGQKFKVKGINPRHPNVLQVESEDGKTTFVSALDTDLIERVYQREADPSKPTYDQEVSNEYLLWP